VGVSVTGLRSQNLLPVRVLPANGLTYSIQFSVRTIPPTDVAPTEI
jgi:hypothetical protein